MSWVAVAGSVKELIGSYEFESLGEGRTRIKYKLAIDPGFPLPGMVKQASAKLIVSTALNELRKHTEKEETRRMLREVAGGRQIGAGSGPKEAGGAQAAAASLAAPTSVSKVTVPSAAAESVEKSIEVSASVVECFEAAAGFEEYPNWAGSVQYVKVLDKTEQGLGKNVEYAVGAFGRTLGYTLSYEFDYPRCVWRVDVEYWAVLVLELLCVCMRVDFVMCACEHQECVCGLLEAVYVCGRRVM